MVYAPAPPAIMAAESRAGLGHWKDFFRSANCGIFNIIEQAIMVAASDYPKELRTRRDRIAELLFSCHLFRLCDSAELAATPEDEEEENGAGFKSEIDGAGSKESKSDSCRDDDLGELNGNQVSNYSYGDAEALTDEIDEVNQIVGEVFRIRGVLQSFEDESDSVLFDSLRRLQLMQLNVDILKATEIGKAVKCLRKSGSKQIRQLAKELIVGWKDMVDEWVKASEALTERTPDSVNPSVVGDEEGLPSPPLDEGAFFSTQDIELSQFFDGMDDDGNPRKNSGEVRKDREGRWKPPMPKQDVISKQREQPSSVEGSAVAKETRGQQMRKQEAAPKPLKAANAQFGPGRPVKPEGIQKVRNEVNAVPKSDKTTIQRRPAPQSMRSEDEDDVKLKLEVTKRKLQERYQQADTAKRQRTVQLMEVHDIPKQGLGQKNGHGSFKSNRQWANGRRRLQ